MAKNYYVNLSVTNPDSGTAHSVTEFVKADNIKDAIHVAEGLTIGLWKVAVHNVETTGAGLR